ncbi:MAG: response regulator [Verrucomicrobiales bacterium]|nr:response regulator [Verrucomicrobiales bacterium]
MQKRVLVIDDSMVNRRVAETKLQNAGFTVQTANDGAAALDLLQIPDLPVNPNFDAILLDVMMPGIDGIEVLRRIRKVWNEVQLPVIMVTSKDKSEDVIEALQNGANDYVTKPLDLAILLARLKTHLRLKEYHESLTRAQESLMSAARIETVGLLAAGVAHEIRNPLGRIQMAVGALKGMVDHFPEEDKETADMLIDTATESVSAADSIVERLMKSFGDQKMPLREVELNETLQKSIEFLRPEIEAAEVNLQTEFEDSLPPVSIAEEEFQQAFVSVFRNALQAMKYHGDSSKDLFVQTSSGKITGIGPNEGGRSGDRLRDGDSVIYVSLTDSGPGMTREQKEAAFDAFFTTKATGAGTGLGLTVARKIIELHKGIIRLEDRDDGKPGLKVSIILKTAGGRVSFV